MGTDVITGVLGMLPTSGEGSESMIVVVPLLGGARMMGVVGTDAEAWVAGGGVAGSKEMEENTLVVMGRGVGMCSSQVFCASSMVANETCEWSPMRGSVVVSNWRGVADTMPLAGPLNTT